MQNVISQTPAHHNVPVPFAADIPGGVFPGKAILVKGVVINSQREERFKIDLCCGKLVQGDHQDDKAIHINPRFDRGGLFSRPDKAIVLNSMINNQWGAEQRYHNTLELDKPFSIRILILRDYFKISLNGKHLSDFIHRVPLESIKCIFVAGCLSIDMIEYQGNRPDIPAIHSNCPTQNAPCLDSPIEVIKPDVPFIFPIPDLIGGDFLPPREIFIILTPQLNARCFSVNLFCAEEYLFHFRVDFPDKDTPGNERVPFTFLQRIRKNKTLKKAKLEGAVIRNNTKSGEWQREERQMGRFPFTPGITSDLKIIASNQGLKVIIDGSFFCDFNYRPSGPIPTELSKITIDGDVGTQKFTFRNREN